MPIHELISYQSYYKHPPTPELEIPVHDGAAEIKKIQENVKKGHYKGLYDFSTDVYKVFMNYRDGHTQVNPSINYLFKYAHPYSIVSVADSPTSKPKVWTLSDDRKKLDQEITKIDGKPVAEYLSSLANSTLESFGFTDPDTRYNMLFAQFPTVASEEDHEHMGYFQYVDQYPGDKFTFTFADGSEQEVEWSARIANQDHLPFFKAGAKEVATLGWIPDEEWEEMTRPWTEEEARQYAELAGWQVLNDMNEKTDEQKKKQKGAHHRVANHKQHGTTKPHPNFGTAGHYKPNGGGRGKPHKRDVEAMKARLRKLKKRTNHDDEVEEDDETYDEDYDDGETTDNPDDGDDNTNTKGGQEPGFPEYFNTTLDGNFRFYSLDGETAVLDVSSFSVGGPIIEASDLLDYGLDYIHSTGHKYLIIDLTNNGGGAAFLPFDFTRTLFPDTWKFESVNMRYTIGGYLMLKNERLSRYWTVEGKDWNSLDDLFSPVERDGDKYTQMFKYDHLEITQEDGHGEDADQKQYFSKDNIVVLSNGYCGSACFAWYESLDRQGVRSYAMGGRPDGSKYMQTSGGIKGGVLFNIEQFAILKHFYNAFDDKTSKEVAETLPSYLRLALDYNGLNVENQFRYKEEDQLPLEFRYNPGCKRFYWTKEMMVDTGYTWKFIREHAWDKHGKPTGCEKPYVPEKPYKPESDKKKGHHTTGSRVPSHPPPKHGSNRVPNHPPSKHGFADVIPNMRKHGSATPKKYPHAKEHHANTPHPDYPPTDRHSRKVKGIAKST